MKSAGRKMRGTYMEKRVERLIAMTGMSRKDKRRARKGRKK